MQTITKTVILLPSHRGGFEVQGNQKTNPEKMFAWMYGCMDVCGLFLVNTVSHK
jgi:hypothetical protein